MGYRERLEKEIEGNRREVGSLSKQLREKKAYGDGLQAALRMIPKEPEANRTVTLRKDSDVARARDAILMAGHALHITEILVALGKSADDKDARISLSGSIGAYVRQGKIFTRPEPNTFGLAELAGKNVPQDDLDVVDQMEKEMKSKATQSLPH